MTAAVPSLPAHPPFSPWPVERIQNVHLEMGQQCNVRCVMCYQTDFRPSTKMPERIWKDRLLPAYAAAKTLTISGGEPTVMSNCRELVQLITHDYPHMELVMVTNGIMFNNFWQDAFLAQGTFLNFSLNAVDSGLYHSIVQFGRQELVLRNIESMVRRRAETGSRVVLRISNVIIDQVIDELPVFIQWAVDHGLDQALMFTDYCRKVHLDPKFVQTQIAAAYAVADRYPQFKLLHLDDFDWTFAKQHGIEPVRPRQILKVAARPCPSPFDTLYVNSDGWVKPCCKSWYLFGNLLQSPLDEVWDSRNARRFRQRMIDLDFRDCLVACDLNAEPVHPKVATVRKAVWVMRRDPQAAVRKGLRKLGLTNAQVKKTKPLKSQSSKPGG